jgi:hypothetical protein
MWSWSKVPRSHSECNTNLGLRVISRPPYTTVVCHTVCSGQTVVTVSSKAACVPQCVQGQPGIYSDFKNTVGLSDLTDDIASQ